MIRSALRQTTTIVSEDQMAYPNRAQVELLPCVAKVPSDSSSVSGVKNRVLENAFHNYSDYTKHTAFVKQWLS